MPNPRIPQFTLVERRRAPRYEVDLCCQATTADGNAVCGRVRDISLTGMQIEGNTDFIRTMYPNFQRSNWRSPIKIKAVLSVPTTNKVEVKVNLECQLVYCNRVASDTYLVGCQYIAIQPEDQIAILNHVQHFGTPKNN